MNDHIFLISAVKTIFQACQRHDPKWQQRRRKIGTWSIFGFLCKAQGREDGAQTVLATLELNKASVPSITAIRNAREKIGWSVFHKIITELYKLFAAQLGSAYLWHGHRVLAIDGSSIHLPRSFVKKNIAVLAPRRFTPRRW